MKHRNVESLLPRFAAAPLGYRKPNSISELYGRSDLRLGDRTISLGGPSGMSG